MTASSRLFNAMKIFAAGIATETNTFSPVPTAIEDYQVQRGRDLSAGRIPYPSLNLFHPWGELAQAHGAEFSFSLNAWAEPSGITLKSAYESELSRGSRAGAC